RVVARAAVDYGVDGEVDADADHVVAVVAVDEDAADGPAAAGDGELPPVHPVDDDIDEGGGGARADEDRVVAVAAADEQGQRTVRGRGRRHEDLVDRHVPGAGGDRDAAGGGRRRGSGQGQGGAAVILGTALGVAVAAGRVARLRVARRAVIGLPLRVVLREQTQLAIRLGHRLVGAALPAQ